MGKVVYTAEATVVGGRDEGHGRTSDGNLELDIRIPEQLGGPGDGTNPEQLFAVGYAACFDSALKTVGRRMKIDSADARVDSKVSLVTNENRGFDIAVELDVTLPSIEDADTAQKLVKATHGVCPYSNATRGNIDLEITVNGEPLAD
ncbi:MAG: organic hydroperoxide resistance protein [Solirubrobacterales bacterium]|nr:organic hydroperoxide resistance protein [Solirubrobacterales bacterium]